MTKKTIKTSKPDDMAILKAQLARSLADYDNLQKRTEEEKLTWIKFATQKFIQDMIPVLDNFESAQHHLKDSGLAIAINQMKEALKNEGLEEIRPKPEDKFDENLEEVVEIIPDKEKDHKIAEVILPGWKFTDGMVLRHAKVKVYKKVEKSS